MEKDKTVVIGAVIAIIVIIMGLYAFGIIDKLKNASISNIQIFNDSQNQKASTGIMPFNRFVSDFRTCAYSPDNNCICPLTAIALPDNGFLEITTKGETIFSGPSGTVFNFYQGTVKSSDEIKKGNLIAGCDKVEEEQEKCPETSEFYFDNVIPKFPLTDPTTYTTPSTGSGYFINKKINGIYITPQYIDIVKFNKAIFKTHSKFATPLYMYSHTNFQPVHSKDFNLQTMYKTIDPASGRTEIYLIPTPDTLVTNGEEYIAQINSMPKCSIPADSEPALKLLVALNEKIINCISKTTLIPNQAELCETFSVSLPASYFLIINIQQKTMFLYHATSKEPIKTYQYNAEFANFNPVSNTASSELQEIKIGPFDSEKILTEKTDLFIYKCPENSICFDSRIRKSFAQ